MDGAPDISVVVPTLDRPPQLRACLAALGRLEMPPGGLEVIVADDGGGVDAAQAQAAAGDAVAVRVIEAGRRGPAAARNAGAAEARATLIAFTDDDCEPVPAWALALLRRHREQPQALLGGPTVNALRENPFSVAAQVIGDAALAHHNADPDRPHLLPSSNVAAAAECFRRLGGFDEAIARAGGEDFELCNRWEERGWPLVWEPEGVVMHSHPLSLRRFWRQQSAYGAGAYHRRRARRTRGGQFELQASATSGVLSIAARSAWEDRDRRRLALLAVWQAANLAGFAGAALGTALGRQA